MAHAPTRPGSVLTLTPAIWRATRENALVEDLSADAVEGTAAVDYENLIPGSFKGRFRRTGLFTPYADCLAVFLTTAYADGSEETAQVGLWITVPAPRIDRETDAAAEVDGRDLVWLLAMDAVVCSYSVAAGTPYGEAVRAVCTDAGFTRFNLPIPASLTLPAASAWPPGTSRLTIANDLLQGCGFHNIATDRTGRLVTHAFTDLAGIEPAVTYTGDADSLVVGEIRREPDTTRLCNRVVVVKENPSEAPLVAVAVNNNPASPTSTASLGVTLTRTVNDPHLASEAAALALARKTLDEGSSLYETLTLSTLPDVAHADGIVVELDVTNAAGETVADGTWWRRGWSLTLGSPGLMTHHLGKIVAFEEL